MNEIHTLNGKRYISKLVEIDGCRRCDLSHTVGSDDYGLKITGDSMRVTLDDKHLNIQISYCPFCGVALWVS